MSSAECSQTSFFRLVKEYDLLTPASQTQNKRRLAFSKQYANEMWQLDTMFGPYVKNGRTSTQSKLICFIDDASRIVPHGQFFFSESTGKTVIKQAVADQAKRQEIEASKRSLRAKRDAGYLATGVKCYGLESCGHQQVRGKPKELKTVRHIFDEYLNGRDMQAIARQLNSRL